MNDVIATILIALASTIVGGLIVGIISLFIEYRFFVRGNKPQAHSKENFTTQKSNAETGKISQESNAELPMFSPYTPYKYILVGFFGGIGGFLSGLLVSFLIEGYWDFGPFIMVPISIVGGIVASILLDVKLEMHKTVLWLRLPLAVITGFAGGIVGVFIVAGILVVAIIGLIIWLDKIKLDQ